MGDDNAVVLVLALLYRLLTSLADGAVLVVLVLAAITAVAGLIAWAGRALPTGVKHEPGSGDATDQPEMTQTEDDRG